jgi:anti-anti-sigma regulatory factor
MVARARWRRTRTSALPTQPADPLVLSITEPVTRDTAPGIVARVNRLASGSPVVIDLTAIPGFDTDGTSALVNLQESLGAGRVTIVGLRQATARLLGSAESVPQPRQLATSPWVVRRLRAIAVVQPAGDGPTSTDLLGPALTAALDEGVGIVVVDLRGAWLSVGGVDEIAFASSSAALHGQELLVVNADAITAERLRTAGLSSTTYVAPEPLPDS